MTEDEARTKWCPFVRFHGTPSDDSIPNRDGGIDSGRLGLSRCVSSKCMAWREVTIEKRVLKDGTEPKPRQAYLAVDVAKINAHVIGGYCGLVGKP